MAAVPGDACILDFPVTATLARTGDTAAAVWVLSAWEDPEAEDAPLSLFWDVASMLGCVLDGDEPTRLGLVEDAGSSLTGLRLVGGDLIHKIERGLRRCSSG